MTNRDIEIFYNKYKNSIGEIARAENRLLKEAYSFEKWFKVLQEKSKLIRQLNLSNTELFDRVIRPVMEGAVKLNKEHADCFLLHIDYFISEGYRDWGVTVPVLDALIPFYQEEKNRESMFDALFYKALAIMQYNHYDEAEAIFNQGIALYHSMDEIDSRDRRFRCMCAYFFRFVSLVHGHLPSEEDILRYYKEARYLWVEATPEGCLTVKKKAAVASILRSITAMLVYRRLTEHLPVGRELFEIIREEVELASDIASINAEVYVAYLRYQLNIRKIAVSEYNKKLLAKFEAEDAFLEGQFSYKAVDFMTLFGEELPDEQFEKDYLIAVNPALNFIQYLLPELLKYNRNNLYLRRKIAMIVYAYYSGFSYISGHSEVDLSVWDTLMKLFPYIREPERLYTLIRTIYVHRQIPTAIHSSMVSRLCETIAEHIYMCDPGFFGELRDKEEIVTFAKTAGFLHDIGKLSCTDIINLQSRKLLDEEFAIIREHPTRGEELLALNRYASRYCEPTKGHHRAYDGKSGYPEDYRSQNPAYKLCSDLVTICDSLDTATDRLCRNYMNAKDFMTVLGELKAGAGTRYNPKLVSMIANNPSLQSEIERLLTEDRGSIQYELYRDYVMPEVHFTEEDERLVRPMTKADYEVLIEHFAETNVDLEPMLAVCQTRLVVADYKGKIYSFLLAEKKTQELYIHALYTPIKYRRGGYAAYLLEMLCELIKVESIDRVFLPDQQGSRYVKFGYRRGFERKEGYPGYMVLEL